MGPSRLLLIWDRRINHRCASLNSCRTHPSLKNRHVIARRARPAFGLRPAELA